MSKENDGPNFDFNDSDFERPSSSAAAEPELTAGEPIGKPEAIAEEEVVRPRQEEAALRPSKLAPASKPIPKWLKVGGISLATVVLISGVGYWIISGLTPHAAPVRQARMEAPAAVYERQKISIAPDDIEEPRQQSQRTRPTQPVADQEPVQIMPAAADDDLGHASFGTSPDVVTSQPMVDAAPTQPTIVSRTSQLEEEDQNFYDNLAKAAANDPSVGSQRSTSSVTNQASAPESAMDPVLAKQVSDMTEQFRQTSAEMTQVLGAMKEVKQQVAEMQRQIKVSDSNNTALTARFSDLDAKLAAFTAKTEARLDKVSRDAVKAAVAAMNAQKPPVAKSGSSGKMVLVGGPMIPDPQPAPKPLVQALRPQQPAKVIAAAPAPIHRIAQPAAPAGGSSCNAKSVSQNWKVKGVSSTTAYIRRESDGVGIMVRADTPVPGFGVVKSFDPNARTICTSDGLIVR